MVDNGFLLDFEQASSHTIKVRVTDSAGASFVKDVAVGVIDWNPEFTLGSAANDMFRGGALNDTLSGGAGGDRLFGAAGNDVRTLAQEIRGKIDPARPAVVAVAARSGGKASLVVAVNGAAKSRGVSAVDLVKGALSGRGGGSGDLAQGGGVPADQAQHLLVAVEQAVGESN